MTLDQIRALLDPIIVALAIASAIFIPLVFSHHVLERRERLWREQRQHEELILQQQREELIRRRRAELIHPRMGVLKARAKAAAAASSPPSSRLERRIKLDG